MSAKRYAMVIDLHKCVGCAACDIACKAENNVPVEFHWSNHITETSGTFPNVKYKYIPTLCNHCENAPCVQNCPTTAMYKNEDGLTLHNADKCIGCRLCQLSCPYGVIWFNKEEPHKVYAQESAPIVAGGGTSTGFQLAQMLDAPLPYYNPARAQTYEGVRPRGVVEKCTFCDHRLAAGEDPACVVACPADARIFGDMNDPESGPSKALAQHKPKVLLADQGTKPRVFYIRDFS
ncbi:4Fe-4S dicluster domain-containing protein [Rubrimonas sp.]|uniref:4Fe-4S dicluster domain-containing protein n=1 Tax=Rubrimonas sp. TaxID=2036015 RepID=UPI002FDD92F5